MRPLIFVALVGACADTEPVRCVQDVDCSGEGTCEPSGYCSYADPSCVTGRRFDEYAEGGRGGECTPGCSASVEAGGTFTCAWEVGGQASCWGSNGSGELGDGNLTPTSWPVQVRYIYDVTDLAAGKSHACAATGYGTVECWGENDAGQVGDGSDDDRTSPIAIGPFPDTVISLAAGDAHTCARLVGGQLWCWGDNRLGQLGSEGEETRSFPALVPGMVDAIGVAMGEGHTCANDGNGDVWCWGYNGYGQLGDGTFTSHAAPRRAGSATLGGATQIVAGGSHTCAVTENRDVWCWGANYSGQIGDGAASGSSVPRRLDLANVLELSAGMSHTCALVGDGSVWCWGANADGQLGDGTRQNRSVPTRVADLEEVVEITAGMAHSCARTLDGRVRCWGSNSAGQLGDGSFDSTPAPVAAASICR